MQPYAIEGALETNTIACVLNERTDLAPPLFAQLIELIFVSPTSDADPLQRIICVRDGDAFQIVLQIRVINVRPASNRSLTKPAAAHQL